MPVIDKQAICKAINAYCFQNIWNQPFSESRVNIKPFLRRQGKSCSGFCYIGTTILDLPNKSDSFFLYAFSLEVSHGVLNMPEKEWISAVDMCNNWDVLAHVYTKEGWMLNKSECLFYIDKKSTSVTMAIPKKALKYLPEADKELYITLYVDSDDVGNTTIQSIKDNQNPAYIFDVIRNIGDKKHQLTVFLNGCNYDPERVEALYQSGDRLDLIMDEDVIAEFDVPYIQKPNTFYSDIDKHYKEIIHIPKVLNPTNGIITFNTCSLYVRDKNDRGAYLHMTGTTTVNQITFNDISVPTYILDAYKDFLGQDLLHMTVKVKTHSKGNTLLRNSNYTDILYSTQTDMEILAHLKGELDPNLTFWKASELERTTFTGFFFDTPNHVTEASMDTFVDALGYYHVVSLICQRVFTSILTDASDKTLLYNKPYIWRNIDVYPVYYVNGQKIPETHVKFQNYNNGTIAIGVEDGVVQNVGDEVTVYFFPMGNRNVYTFVPTESETSLTVPNNIDFTIYEEVDHGGIDIKGLYKTTQYGYIEREIEVGKIIEATNSDGTKTLTFSSDEFGKKFVIQYELATYTFTKDLTEDIADGKAFVIDLEVESATEEGKMIPLLNCKDACVYFNGRYLVRDVDYRMVISDALDGSLCLSQIVVNNMAYGKDTDDNSIEVVLTSVGVTNHDDGFVIDNQASTDLDIDIWFPELSTIHVDGIYDRHVNSTGIGLHFMPGKHRTGAIFELKTAIPDVVLELLAPNTDELDRMRIQKIEDYLRKTLIPPGGDVILTRSHKVFSVYLNFLVMGMLDGSIKISYDPVTERMLDQLDPYEYVKAFDSVFRDPEDPLNTRFIDIYPAFKELTVGDESLRQTIIELTNLILPKDEITSGVIVR